MSAQVPRLLVTALIVGVAYYAGAWIGFTTVFPDAGIARRHLFWPPNVILLAALLVTPVRWWWPCGLAAFAAHLLAHAQLGLAPAVMALPVQFAGNFFQAILVAFALRRLNDPPWRVDTLRSMIVVIAIAGVAAPALVSALVILIYVWAGWMPDTMPAWSVRFLANAVSTITLAPLLFSVAAQGLRGLRDIDPRRAAEFVAVLAGLLVVGALTSGSARSGMELPLLYAPLPLLLWAAVRFGSSGLSIALVATLLLFVGAPFGAPSVASVAADNTMTLAVFLLAIAIPLLLLSAVVQERRNKEQALEFSEARYRAVVEDQTELICRFLPDGTYTFVNDAYCRYFRRSREELLGSSFWIFIPPAGHRAAREFLESITPERPIATREHEVLAPDGEVRWQQWRDRGFFDGRGRLVEYQAVGRDITDRKRAEDKSRELVHNLGERVKELTALHRAAHILQNEDLPMSDLLQQFVGVLPAAWQYPEITAARIRLGELEFATPNFKPTPWIQRADFSVAEGLRGAIEVVYLAEKPAEQEGPFIAEERSLIDSLAEVLRAAIERRQAQEQVSLLQTIAMEVGAADDLSSALAVVLRRVCEKTGWAVGQAWIPRSDGAVLDCSPAWFCVATGLDKFRNYSEAMSFLPGMALPGRVWSSKQPAWIPDATLEPNFPRAQVAGEVGLKAALGIPIVSGNEVLAVIEFFMRETRREDERLVKVITAVAAQLGLVIERKRSAELLRKNETVLRESYDRIQDLAGRLITAQEAERSRIAGELHDDVNQQLAGLSIALSNVKRQLQSGANGTVQEEISRLQGRTIDLADVIRGLSHELHPGILQHAGLVAALRGHCVEFGAQHAIEVTLSAADGLDLIPHDTALCLYRVVQEALRNIAEHAGAHKAEVTLRATEDVLELIVADDGQGFDLAEARSMGGLGLISLDERVRLIGGSLTIHTALKRGTEMRVRVPWGGSR
jgi:PAS domain S-box-containing protein